MSYPRVVAVDPESPAALGGVEAGDELLTINGVVPRDVIEYRLLVDEGELSLDLSRGGLSVQVDIDKPAGSRLGIEVESALFDQVRTCDNHCDFCFIYQLPPGMRSSLYLKDDDYRLSFLYGNFTTLTRFTEADLERVVTEGLSPLHVSIHSTAPDLRSDMLRNRRGALSLRWLRALLDHGIEVHGQVVVCPGVNDGAHLDETLCGVLERFPELATICVVPLGISRFSTSDSLRPHTAEEAQEVVDIVHRWQDVFAETLGHRLVHAADEYYLMADRPFPSAERYEGFPMHEDGVGMARTIELEFNGAVDEPTGTRPGFFAWVDGAPAEGYRAPRTVMPTGDGTSLQIKPRRTAPVAVLTGSFGAQVLAPLISSVPRNDVRIVTVDNHYFGGNIGVAGLMVGADLARTLESEPTGHRYLLPDVCLSEGRFLDGMTPAELPRPVEIVSTDGCALRLALDPVPVDGQTVTSDHDGTDLMTVRR